MYHTHGGVVREKSLKNMRFENTAATAASVSQQRDRALGRINQALRRDGRINTPRQLRGLYPPA